MHRFKKILVHFEGPRSERALEQAARLAKLDQGKLHVVDVSNWLPDYSHMLAPRIHLEELYKSTADSKRESLEELVEPIRKEGIEVTTDSLHGTPFLEITGIVIQGGHDLVIKTAGETGWFKQAFFGTTDFHLLRKCPCPVWIVNPEEPHRYGRILAAVDTTSSASEHATLSKKILELGSAVAVSHQAEFQAIHCLERLEQSSLGSVEGVSFKKMEAVFEEAIHKVRDTFERVVSDHVSTPTKAHFLEGAPEYEIPRFVDEHRVDLLVMGTIGRTGIPGFFIGNSAERVLEQIECSVLAVKPDGFVSPVSAPEVFLG